MDHVPLHIYDHGIDVNANECGAIYIYSVPVQLHVILIAGKIAKDLLISPLLLALKLLFVNQMHCLHEPQHSVGKFTAAIRRISTKRCLASESIAIAISTSPA